MKGYEVAQGRGIEYMDIVNRKKVCVVGSYVAQTCFGGNAVGQSLKVGGTTFTIVGVMAQEAEQMEEGGTRRLCLCPLLHRSPPVLYRHHQQLYCDRDR